MKLEEIVPEVASFTLGGKTYELRPPTIADFAVWQREYGDIQGLMAVFSEQRWPAMCKIAFRLLKDQSDFLARKEQVTDDDGITSERLVLAPERIFRALGTFDEGLAFQKAINIAFAAANPKETKASPEKKSEVKNEQESLTGLSSSSSSQLSTDTHQMSSETLQAVRSAS